MLLPAPVSISFIASMRVRKLLEPSVPLAQLVGGRREKLNCQMRASRIGAGRAPWSTGFRSFPGNRGAHSDLSGPARGAWQRGRRSLINEEMRHRAKAETVATESLWKAIDVFPSFPPLPCDVRADVCIVGAGFAGVSTGYLLARAGR